MRLNPSKFEALCISNKHLPIKFNYQLNGCFLEWSSTVKYLRVILNAKLTWNDQCTYIVSKATRMLNLLCQNLFACSSAAKNKAFRSLVIPILEYASQVWNHILRKMSRNCKVCSFVLLVGWLAAVLTGILWNGPNHHWNAVATWTGLNCLLDVDTYLC